ncbi:MAG: formyltetrahydrofolate deformylase, partial [Paraglaciecola sp.]
MSNNMQQTFRLVIDCPDQIGLVAAVSQFLAEQNATIVEASHHTDQQTGRFFMRHEIKAESITMSLQSVKQAFEPIAERFQMHWKIADSLQKQKVVMLASHESHCLMDILHRWHSG